MALHIAAGYGRVWWGLVGYSMPGYWKSSLVRNCWSFSLINGYASYIPMNLQPHGSSGNIILSPSATQISQAWAARQPEHFASFLAGLSPSPHLKRSGSHKKLGTGAGKQPWFWRFSFDPWTEGWNKHWSLKVMTHGLPTIESHG